jgi:hypothetical protein
MPGDVLEDGTKLAIRPGHIAGEEGYFTSPTIRYAELDVYATPTEWNGHTAKVVLQLRQQPGSYTVQPETVNWATKNGFDKIDENFNNNEVERNNTRRSTTLIYGILIKLTNTRAKRRRKTKEFTPVEAGKMVVSWSDPHSVLGDCGVESSQVIKCQPHEFVKVGDSVKAACDLDYSTIKVEESKFDSGKGLVKEGSLGVVRMLLAGKMVVSWSDPHSVLGDCGVESSQVIKCQPHEFVKVGDSVKAACDLDYSTIKVEESKFDSGKGLVKEGSLGVVRSLVGKW